MGDWPLKYHDAAASNATDSPLAPPLRLRWKQKVRTARYAVSNGKTLFVLGYDNLYGLDLQSGKLLREYKGTSSDPDDKVAQEIACNGDLLLYKSICRIAAIHPDSGRTAWRRDLPRNPACWPDPLVCGDGMLHFAGLILSCKNGRTLWANEKLFPENGGLVAACGEYVVACTREANEIVCLKGWPPRKAWSVDPQGRCMYIGTDARSVFAVIIGKGTETTCVTCAWALWNGKLLWREESSYRGHCIVGDRLFMLSNTEKLKQAFIAVDTQTGKEVWRNSDPLFLSERTPIASGSTIWLAGLFRDDKGEEVRRLIAVNRETGETLWRLNLTQYPERLLIADNLLVVTCERMVYCYEPDNSSAKAPAKKPTARAVATGGVRRQAHGAPGTRFPKTPVRPKGHRC